MSDYIFIEDLTFKVMLIHKVEIYANGLPKSRGWRRRLNDATLDSNCVILDNSEVRRIPMTNRYIKV